MVNGDVAVKNLIDPASLPLGAALTGSGRISSAKIPGSTATTPPFTKKELMDLDAELQAATEESGVHYSVYIGDLGSDAVTGAQAILPTVPEAEHAALIAVSPNSRDIVVLSGINVTDKINDRVAQLGVTAAIAGFRDGNLIDGLISALRVMSAAATRS